MDYGVCDWLVHLRWLDTSAESRPVESLSNDAAEHFYPSLLPSDFQILAVPELHTFRLLRRIDGLADVVGLYFAD